jgi:dihydropteroate synthase
MKIKRVKQNTEKLLSRLNVDVRGIEIMSAKTQIYIFHVKQIRCGAANILKQDALSVGAEFALPYGTIECKNTIDQGVLIGNKRVLLTLCKKLQAQPYGLKELAKTVKAFLNTPEFEPKIMGVINTNDDSFNAASRFKGDAATTRIETMIAQGAEIIDVGGVSSRPGSVYCGVEEELRRVQDVLQSIDEKKLFEKAVFSIDSFEPKVVEKALRCGFKIINDITGLQNPVLAKLAKEYGAQICIMHMQNNPQDMQKAPVYEDVVLEVEEFFAQRLEIAYAHGLSQKDVILDVGIGFGKTLEHNIELLTNLNHFQKFGCELLVGASRKSMIDKIAPAPVEQRLGGTLALHLLAYRNGASILRAHDVFEHVQALNVCKALKDF